MTEEKDVQESENLVLVSHKEENRKTKKEKVKEKGKAPINIPKDGHNKLQIKSLQMKNEEYKILNDNLTEEIIRLEEERSTGAENKKGKSKSTKEVRAEKGKRVA